MLLTAYFDESGTHRGNHLCVVAGFFGTVEQWTSFIAEWIPALGQKKNLHMRTLYWANKNRISRLLGKLGPIPQKHGLTPCFGGIWRQDHEALIEGKVIQQCSVTPYALAAFACMKASLSFLGRSDEITFVFDQQDRFGPAMLNFERTFDICNIDSRVCGVSYVPQRKTVCLDPADYLAFSLREYYTDKNSEKAVAGMSILENCEGGRGQIYDEKQLRMLVRSLQMVGLARE